ncbi:hypothetical protein [Haladaptatus sp. DJG-WS-42]|uniref:hypothetical protein n=1 Tax=Haladaptatus sp. DJG-WS-42 TaxID=3120516 RepID=UPI0030CCFA85
MALDRRLAVSAFALAGLAGAIMTVSQYLQILLNQPFSQLGGAAFVVSVLGFLVSPVLAVVLGYVTGKRVDVAVAYKNVLTSCFGGALVGLLLGTAIVTFVALDGQGGLQVTFPILGSAYTAILRAMTFTLFVFAGAAFATFRTGAPAPTHV